MDVDEGRFLEQLKYRNWPWRDLAWSTVHIRQDMNLLFILVGNGYGMG